VIDFRYHVVSIVAVFLALAIGIVLGSTELQGTTIDVLRNTSQQIKNQYDATHARNVELNQQVNADQAFAQAAEAQLLDGLLSGQRVVVVNAPGASGSVVTGVTKALRDAGATVAGEVNLQPKLLDASQSNQQFLTQLVQQLAAPGSVSANGTGLQQAARLLGSVILTKSTDPNGSTSGSASGGSLATSARTILQGYAQAGLLSISGQPSAPATLAVVVTPSSAPSDGVSDPANQGLITLAQQPAAWPPSTYRPWTTPTPPPARSSPSGPWPTRWPGARPTATVPSQGTARPRRARPPPPRPRRPPRRPRDRTGRTRGPPPRVSTPPRVARR
jgi:hypothetical protein